MVLAYYARRLLTVRQPPGDGESEGVPSEAQGTRPLGPLAELRQGPAVSPVDVPVAVQVVRLIVLVGVIVTVPLSTPHFGQGAQGMAVAVMLAIAAVSWAAWQFAGDKPRLWLALLAVMGLAGGALAGLSSLSTAVAVGFVVTAAAGARVSTEMSLAIVAETVASFLIAAIVSGADPEAIIGWGTAFIGMWAFGLTRRAYLLRAQEAEEALEQARRAHTAETQAAALAERARIAREIHDVLAHALAAVSVNLQAAEGLLEAVPEKGPELAKAAECVERAGALTKKGMAEARRAILALRDHPAAAQAGHEAQPSGGPAGPAADAGTPGSADTPPERLTSQLRAMIDEHRAAGDAPVEFTVTGTPRPLGTDAALTAYRTVQEALTNARKHAPGQPVLVAVTYAPDDMTLLVTSPLCPPAGEGPLARTGTGYGLTGLRERAALVNGTLTAGPHDGQWQVRLKLPR